MTITLILLCRWWTAGQALPPAAHRAINWLVVIGLLQVALGIATLLLVVPVPLGVAHQAGAVLLVTAGILSVHAVRELPD